MAGAFGQSAVAAPPNFRLADIGTIGFEPFYQSHGVAALNNFGEVVYGKMDNTNIEAFVWLSKPKYGLTDGLHFLHDLPGNTAVSPGIANSINYVGKIAGRSADIIDISAAYATVWDLVPLADPEVEEISVYTLDSGSIAHSINDHVPPKIAGSFYDDGPCKPSVGDDTLFAFLWELGQDEELLGPAGSPLAQSQGFSISNSSDSTVVGVGATCDFHSICDPEVGHYWQNAAGLGTIPDTLNVCASGVPVMRAVNTDDRVAGWIACPTGQIGGCTIRAAYWPEPDGDPESIGSDLFPNLTIALGLNDFSPPWIVGQDENAGVGILYIKDGSNWDAYDLNDYVEGCYDLGFEIVEAHAVNSRGQIVAVARDESDDFHLVLLTPIWPCSAEGDINNDGCVNVDDQLEVINGWGACNGTKVCIADTDLDCDVDVDDLLAVINGWCPDPCDDPPSTCCQFCSNCGESLMGGGGGGGSGSESSGPPTIAELIAYVLVAGIPEQTKEEIIAALLEL